MHTIYVGIPKSMNATVECDSSSGQFLVTYFLSISGPPSLCNNYLRVAWRDSDGAAFTIGQGGSQKFSGTGTLNWNSSKSLFSAKRKNNITLTLTFLTTAATGKYDIKMWVAFTPALSAIISPSCATLHTDKCQPFTSTVTGGTCPYKYQWYLNGAAVSGATKSTWIFAPNSAGSYAVYVKVTDSTGVQATSNTAVVTVK